MVNAGGFISVAVADLTGLRMAGASVDGWAWSSVFPDAFASAHGPRRRAPCARSVVWQVNHAAAGVASVRMSIAQNRVRGQKRRKHIEAQRRSRPVRATGGQRAEGLSGDR